ncbi:NADP-dependent 3-hydroxy acid dehydrogenase YdfG [Loktanella fryxellensis]|uniref:NADP-dependent 3-hydroxy acid dehydrogenase YdfG n=1 Tax=Loktanella fryxellensis TaxID=245187 RepID=A0A1H7YYE2_9RHOB|nr:SDR family oxidoreductase [Loktanella fryxellensis]SEM51180.1 NADP-dependent 3-hydroxy acid dehydrogenase YdfG [Loktanella fryxellensis]
MTDTPQKTLFITGASSGIGEATARAAVASGWRVGLFARRRDKLEGLAQELGDAALVLTGDVTDYDDQVAALDRLAQHFGRVHAAFANAGRGAAKGGVGGGDVDDWQGLIDLNVVGLLKTAKAALPHLEKTRGHMVLTGSAAGRVHLSGSIYGATKWFVHGFAGNLAEEMKGWGGRCTVIAPGMVNTPFFDEAKPDKLQPADVAGAVMMALNAADSADVREVFLMPRG